jgi:cytidine deaminase
VTLRANPAGPALDALAREVRAFLDGRFPSGEHGAAGMLLDDGEVVTSTSPDASNPAVEFCHELGAFAEAHKRDRRIVASLCLRRQPDGRMLVLSPCGVCLERLSDHGTDVLLAVTTHPDPTSIRWVTLREALPFDWRGAVSASDGAKSV